MNICPYCGASYSPGESRCPRCRNTLQIIKTQSVTVTLSRKEARRGCVRSLRYPGAPRPIRVHMPEKLYDGAELFLENGDNLINELDFLIERLGEYRTAIAEKDADTLIRILDEGRMRKKAIDEEE